MSICWRDYIELCKPRVVMLMLITTLVGMYLATPSLPPISLVLWGLIGIALCAFCAAAINHLIDRKIDLLMARTQRRPVAEGRISPCCALAFAITLGLTGTLVLLQFVNTLTAILTLSTLLGYAVCYTVFLKRATPQNIVIGGAAGAAPPLLGWCAITNTISPYALLLMLIIFTWTPPHFWALALYRAEDYKNADIPMLPVTHGPEFTKLCILLYTVLLLAVTSLPFITAMSGWFYFISALLLNIVFLKYSITLFRHYTPRIAKRTFAYSIIYLKLLFIVLLIDHYFV